MNYTTTVPLRDALGDDSNVNHRTNGPIGTSTPKKNQQPQRKPTRTIAQINRTAHLEKIGAFSDPGVTKQFGRVKNTFLG